ncbi:MAG TPA: glycosyltransferase family 4 protein [Jiangellaceae bacterium]|nr:glycosyltransferase family 4 protein [Jiangellaceae bacterium]
MNPRRLAYVCTDPGIGLFGTKGASVHMQEVIRVLRARGAQVEVFCAKRGGDPPADLRDLVVHLLPQASKAVDPAARERALIDADDATEALLEEHGPFDLVYQRYSLWNAGTTALADRRGWPSILEVNAPLIEEHERHRGLVHRDHAAHVIAGAAGRATAVVCVSDPVATWVRRHAPAANTVVVPNGVNTERIRPGTPDTHRADIPFTIGFVGTFKPWHGVDVLLESFARLRATRDNVRLLLVGDGPQGPELRARVAALGMTDDVVFTGPADPDDVPTWLQAMDTAVAPYPATADTYFSPLKLYEYLAAGLPVVASAVGQIPTALTSEKTGLLVPPGDIDALTAALHRLADEPNLCRRLARAGRTTAVERHSWDRVMRRSLQAAGLDAEMEAVA